MSAPAKPLEAARRPMPLFEPRAFSRALLLAWMSRETPTLDAAAICLALALRHDAVNAAHEGAEEKSFVSQPVAGAIARAAGA